MGWIKGIGRIFRRRARIGAAGPSLAIIGAGPAGLSFARLLSDGGFSGAAVYEAQDRVGGKSLSIRYAGIAHDMGTCYSTLAHRRTNQWMQDLGIRQIGLGKQLVDGLPFMDFVRAGPGQSLAIEGLRYLNLWRAHQAALAVKSSDPAFLSECALPVEDWLAKHKLVRIRRFMLRAMTAMGYGQLNEVSILQAMRWCTPGLIASGALNQVKMPVDGWQPFWELLAETLDVRFSEPVIGIERRADRVVITTRLSETQYDNVLITAPIDELRTIMKLTDEERSIAASIEWGSYITTLFKADNWFTDHQAEGYSERLLPGAFKGPMLGARRIGADRSKEAGTIYLSGQLGGGHSDAALLEQLAKDVAAAGGTFRFPVFQKRWKYFPRYRLDAIKEGLVKRMEALQGQHNTWYSGASFSHEAVSNIVAFNERLIERLLPALRR